MNSFFERRDFLNKPFREKMGDFKYRVFQKELSNFEGLYVFTQRTCTVFRTVIMYQNVPSFMRDSYGPMQIPLVMQDVSKSAL
jgi:hypothetical protein